MSKVQTLRGFINQRLSAAAEEIFELFERSISEYEETLYRQNKLLDAVFKPEVRLHRADVPQLLVTKEEDPPEQQECSPSLDQNDVRELPRIKEELEELRTSDEREQLRGLEEADITKSSLTPVPLKSEEDGEEKPQSSELHQIQTEEMNTEADGEDPGGPEPARSSDPDRHLEPDTDDKTSDSSDSETDDSDDWKKSNELQSCLNPVKSTSGCKTVELSFSCSQCGKQFKQNSHLKRHMMVHTGEKPFSCSVCSKTFTQKVNMTRHIARHTGEKQHSCSTCGKRFTWQSQLNNHQCDGHQSSGLHQSQTGDRPNTEHLKTEADRKEGGGSKPARKLNPDKHLQPDTDDKTSDSSGPETDESCEWEETREPQSGLNTLQNNEAAVNYMKCNAGKTSVSSSERSTGFGHKGDQQDHDGSQTVKKPFTCSVCGKTYPRKNSLITHMRLHSEGKRLHCSVCNKTFHLRENVVRHMRTHTGEKPFSCSVCANSFAQSEILRRHMRIHTQEKPFSCSLCSRKFTYSTVLTSHLRVHTGEKPFTCSVCRTSFSQRTTLSSHMRVHSGEKPFRCSVCDKTFTNNGNLKRHSFVHKEEKPFSCSVCGNGFGNAGNLRRHAAVHTGEKPFSCSVCDKRFTRFAHVKTHKCVGENSRSR